MRHSPSALLALAVTAALAGCSALDLGPAPSNYVGPGQGHEPKLLTDPTLQAVIPTVPGDKGNGVDVPGAMVPATMSAVNPNTMPAATQPTTTRPATEGTVTDTRPSLGKGEPLEPIPESLSVQNAILVGLLNNHSLKVQRYNVPIQRTNEEQARAAFDPTLTGSIQGGRTGNANGSTDAISGSVGLGQFLPTGTTIDGNISSNNSFYSDASSSFGPGLTVSQALLRGASLEANLASIRSAELSTKITQYQLRATAETLVANIETTYWDLAYAERQVVIVQNALDVAQRQFDETNTRIRLEVLPQSELPAAEAEVASRREQLINAKSTLETTRMRFLQLITPVPQEFWSRTISLSTIPFTPTGTMDPVDAHMAVALRLRPDLNQSKLQMQRGDLEIVRTKNGLLPRVDLFVNLSKTGIDSNFGNSITGLNGPNYQAVVGIRGDIDLINRGPNASYRASVLSREQVQESFDNLTQLAQLDVRTQYIEVERTRQQIDATRATRIAQEANFKVQQGKLAAGSGTSLLVAIAQRDLLSAQLSEIQSVTAHLKALVELYRLEGSLLFRRGLEAPGGTPVEGIAWH